MDSFRADVAALVKKDSIEQVKPNNGYFFVGLNTLRFGDKGDQVKALQILLLGNGFPCGKWGADGDFGIATENALKEYQQKKKLTVDGIAGPITGGKLLGVS